MPVSKTVPVVHGPVLTGSTGATSASSPLMWLAGQMPMPVESSVKRTATTNTFLNTDGSHLLQASSVPLNYRAGDGSWRPIDNTLKPDPSMPGGYVSTANSWHVHFGPSDVGVVMDSGASGAMAFAPSGGALVDPTLGTDGVSVTYPNVWPNVDLRYTVTSSGVQESILVKSASAATTFPFTTRTGALAEVLGSTGNSATIPSFARASDGSLTPNGPLGARMSVQQPAVLDGHGAQQSGTGVALTATTQGLTVSVGHSWLAAQPSSAFPIDVDPSFHDGQQSTWSYKSDGYSCTNCQIQIGNSRDNGDTYWRSIAGFNLSALEGTQILGSSVAATLNSGSGGYGVWMDEAATFSYSGAVYGPTLAYGVPGSAGTLSDQDGKLTSILQWAADSNTGTGYFGFIGAEAPGYYTYNNYATTLYVNYNVKPTVATPIAPSPVNGASFHPGQGTVTLAASASDGDGDALQYYFRVATGSDGETNQVFNSGWQSSNTATFTVPPSLWNTKLYWHVYAQDPTYTTAPNYVYSFTPTNQPAAAASQSGAGPGNNATVATTTPTLSVPAATDPDGDVVSYDFTIANSAAGEGRASSGWQTGTSWTVPTGVLQDGQAYQWSVMTADGPASSTAGPWSTTSPRWSNTVTVNQRLGATQVSPTDSLAGTSVNLANGNLTVSASTHAMNTVSGPLGIGLTYNSQASQTHGLLGQYFEDNNRQWDFSSAGSPALVRVDPTLNMIWNENGYPLSPPGLPTSQYLVKWTGYLTLPATDPAGKYELGMLDDDGARILWNNNTTPIFQDWGGQHGIQSAPVWSSAITLTPGVAVPVEVDYYNQGGPGQISMYVEGTDSTTSPAVASQIVPTTWLAPTISSLPAGWTLSLPGLASTYSHASVGPNAVVLTDSSGQAHTYRPTGDGGYLPPAGEDGVLTVGTGNAVSLHDADGTVYTFDSQGNPLSATTAADITAGTQHPAEATYSYSTDVTPARVTAITDPVSKQSIAMYYGTDSHCGTIPVGYDQSVAANLLCGVVYWDGTTTNLYYANGQLATIKEPGSTYTQFGYSDGLMTAIESPPAVDWQGVDPTGRANAPVTTAIGYTWVNPAAPGSTNIRPAYSPATQTNGLYPAGSIPLVTSVTAPSPDGATTTARPEDSYTYVGLNETQVHVAGLATAVDRDVTYDSSGRLLTSTSATGQRTTTTWDAEGQDLQTSVADAAGRETTTIYDWANRPTDVYGPAPASCFQSNGLPVASPPASCGKIPHTHTGYDTDTSGNRMQGLEASVWTNPDQSGPPSSRVTASPNTGSWTTAQSSLLAPKGGSVQFTGELSLPEGTYNLAASVGDRVNDGARVYLNGVPVIDRWTTYNQAVMGDSPSDFWRFNDPVGSTTAANQVSGATAGTPTSVTFGTAGPGPVDTATAATFNPTTSKVTVPNAADLPDGTGAFSIEATVYVTGTSNNCDMLVTKDLGEGNSNDPYEFSICNGVLQLLQDDGTTYYKATSTGGVSMNAWHQVAVTKAADGQVEFYIDGTQDPSTNKLPTNIATNTQPVIIGQSADGWGFQGQIADVALYRYALSNTQAASHYRASVAVLNSAANTATNGNLPATVTFGSTPRTIRIDYRNPAQAANLSLTATNTSTGAVVPLTGAVLDPRFGLATYHSTDDVGGIGSGAEVTATSYSGDGLDPSFGLATDNIIDPGGTGHLNLDTKTAYEAPGTGYLRETGQALPSASIGNAAQSHTSSYYGDRQLVANPCVSGSAAVNQAGLPHVTTDATPASGSAVATEAVYDVAGRIVASRNPADGNNWTCTTYDARGRVSQVTVPAVNGAAARSISYNYAVGGNPLISSVTDAQGTITTTMDLLGRTVSYTDTTGTVTTTTYDQAGRATSQTLTAPGGGTSTVADTYLDDGRLNTVSVDGKLVANPSYDSYAQLTGVTYPTGTGDAGNGTSLGNITRDPAGRTTGQTWSLPGTQSVADTATLSQAGRVKTDTAAVNGTTNAAWTYGYDNAGRLTTADLAAAGARPSVAYAYGFAASGGCGADPAAGQDSARSSQTITIGTNAPSTTVSCTDYASRLTAITGTGAIPASQIVYDAHGNMTRLGGQSFGYDASDRLDQMTTTGTGTSQTVKYTLDTTGRVVTRTATGTGTGTENDTTTYAYASGSDTPTAQLTATKALGEAYLSLPGGVLLTKHYANPGSDNWAYPNLHGDITATAGPTGTLTGSRFLYDPFGQPLDPTTGITNLTATPKTRTNGPTDAWEGQHQRGYENTGGDNAILMGARAYLPADGQFTAIDPVLDGNANPYVYPTDPINRADLTGRCGWGCWLSVGGLVVAQVAVDVATCIGTGCTGDAAEIPAEVVGDEAIVEGSTEGSASEADAAAQKEAEKSLTNQEKTKRINKAIEERHERVQQVSDEVDRTVTAVQKALEKEGLAPPEIGKTVSTTGQPYASPPTVSAPPFALTPDAAFMLSLALRMFFSSSLWPF